MPKVDLELVKMVLTRNDVETRLVADIIKEIQQESAAETDEEEGTRREEAVCGCCIRPRGPARGNGVTGSIVQIPEDESVYTAVERLHRAGYEFNTTKKGRRMPVKTVGEVCEHVPARIAKEQKIWIKHKEPCFLLRTDGILRPRTPANTSTSARRTPEALLLRKKRPRASRAGRFCLSSFHFPLSSPPMSSVPDSGRYAARGVSASKGEVHAVVDKLDRGLFPVAFCKITEDFLTGNPELCNVTHSDGSGTKSLLAYLWWKETGDASVFRGIAQDSIVMNIDDLLCVGATNRILLSSTINRNARNIPGEVLGHLIQGTEDFLATLREHGFEHPLRRRRDRRCRRPHEDPHRRFHSHRRAAPRFRRGRRAHPARPRHRRHRFRRLLRLRNRRKFRHRFERSDFRPSRIARAVLRRQVSGNL